MLRAAAEGRCGKSRQIYEIGHVAALTLVRLDLPTQSLHAQHCMRERSCGGERAIISYHMYTLNELSGYTSSSSCFSPLSPPCHPAPPSRNLKQVRASRHTEGTSPERKRSTAPNSVHDLHAAMRIQRATCGPLPRRHLGIRPLTPSPQHPSAYILTAR